MKKHRHKRADHPAVVVVEWHDSRTLTARWEDRTKLLDDAVAMYDETIVTAGLLLEVRKAYIVVAVGLAPNDDVMHALQIPKSEICRFEIGKPRRGGKWKKVK